VEQKYEEKTNTDEDAGYSQYNIGTMPIRNGRQTSIASPRPSIADETTASVDGLGRGHSKTDDYAKDYFPTPTNSRICHSKTDAYADDYFPSATNSRMVDSKTDAYAVDYFPSDAVVRQRSLEAAENRDSDFAEAEDTDPCHSNSKDSWTAYEGMDYEAPGIDVDAMECNSPEDVEAVKRWALENGCTAFTVCKNMAMIKKPGRPLTAADLRRSDGSRNVFWLYSGSIRAPAGAATEKHPTMEQALRDLDSERAEREEPEKKCPQDHELVLVQAEAPGSCDQCGINVARGKQVMECLPCDYWLCEICCDQKQATKRITYSYFENLLLKLKEGDDEKKCKQGHVLVPLRTLAPGYCDQCGINVARGKQVMECSPCDYWLCQICCNEKQALQEPEAQRAVEEGWLSWFLAPFCCHGARTQQATLLQEHLKAEAQRERRTVVAVEERPTKAVCFS